MELLPRLFGFILRASSWWSIAVIRLAFPTSDLSSFAPAEEFLLLLGIFSVFFGMVICWNVVAVVVWFEKLRRGVEDRYM